jgi:Raf kinase inhibitor-like YbhB/YbcL family protein
LNYERKWNILFIEARDRMTKSIKFISWLISTGLFFVLVSCKGEEEPLSTEGEIEMSITITSSAFSEGDKIPRLFTCDDKNVSPPLSWSGVPSNSVSLVIIMDDPDAPSGTWVHWVLYNLPGELSNLDQGATGKGTDGKNDFNRTGYGGPCPPRGSNHRYLIKVYALDTRLDLKSGATKAQVENGMRGHILAQGQLMGRYGR